MAHIFWGSLGAFFLGPRHHPPGWEGSDQPKPRANLKEERGGKIRVTSSEGTPVIDEGHEPGAFMAVVLASHGETGQGAYKGNGQRGKIEGPEALPALPPLHDQESPTLERRLVWESRDVFLKKRVKLKEE